VQLSQLAETLCDLEVTGADIEGICRDVFSFAIQSTEEDNSITITSDMWTRALTNWKQPSSSNYEDVKAILTSHLSHVPMDKTVQLSQLAETLCDLGVTGADVEGICRDVFSQSTEEDNSSTSDLWTRALTKWKQPSS